MNAHEMMWACVKTLWPRFPSYFEPRRFSTELSNTAGSISHIVFLFIGYPFAREETNRTAAALV